MNMKFLSSLFFFTALLFVSGCGFNKQESNVVLDDDFVPFPHAIEKQSILDNDMILYKQEQAGISFAYPKQWPEPEYFSQGTFGDGGFQPEEKSQWTIGVDKPTNYLGEDVFPFGFMGFGVQNAEEIIKKLEADEMIQVEKDMVQNGSRVIVYSEGGICGSQNALIFGIKTTVLLQGRCAAENMERKNQFEVILQSVSFLQ